MINKDSYKRGWGGCCWLLYSSDLISSVPRVKSERDLIFDFVQMKIIYSYSKVILKKQKLVAVILPFPLHNIPFLLVYYCVIQWFDLVLTCKRPQKSGRQCDGKKAKMRRAAALQGFCCRPWRTSCLHLAAKVLLQCVCMYVCVCMWMFLYSLHMCL